jgi:hypothetical protein
VTLLTRSELARGRALVERAFDGPWRYTQFEIECASCNGGDGPECVNPECSGAGGGPPATFVEAPEQYPASDKHPQIVATIEVPGISDLAQQNGECICWLRNNATALIEAKEKLDEMVAALAWLTNIAGLPHPPQIFMHPQHTVETVLDYARGQGWKGPDAP